ncbi:MAG: hypothetical protein KDD58_04815, partial [Bdellovibrionales bacterium]|nr:hypothetical protein [Bdellovibrionales bacterium]
QRFGYHLRAIIINRCPPDWGLVETKLKGLCDDFEGYYSSVKAEIEDFKKILKKRVKILKIYELDSDLSGVSELSVMADKVEKALKEGAGA